MEWNINEIKLLSRKHTGSFMKFVVSFPGNTYIKIYLNLIKKIKISI